MTEKVASWSIADVQTWLAGLGLPAETVTSFKTNAIDGGDLSTLTDADLTAELGCTQLQARKIRQHLTQLGVPAPPASEAPSHSASAASLAAEPAPSAPPQPAAFGSQQEPDPPNCFQPADLQRYQQLRTHGAELQGMQPASKVSQAQQFLQGVKRGLDAAQAALPPTLKALAVEQEHISKYSGEKFSLGKVFTTQHHRDVKLAESQAKAESLTNQQHEQEKAIKGKQVELQEAQRQLAAWQAKASELASTQQQLMEHVERMFSSPAWRASPRQTELADALRALAARSAEAERGHGTYGRGAQLLNESTRLIQDALQQLQRTQTFSMMELGMGIGDMGRGFGRQPGDLFMDMAEMALIRRANDEISMAAQKTMEARMLLPGLPQVDAQVLSSAKTGIFANMLMGGGIGMDMLEIAMIRRSKQQVEMLLQQVSAAAGWAQSNLAVYQQQDAALKAQAAAKKGELEAFRKAALQAALGA